DHPVAGRAHRRPAPAGDAGPRAGGGVQPRDPRHRLGLPGAGQPQRRAPGHRAPALARASPDRLLRRPRRIEFLPGAPPGLPGRDERRRRRPRSALAGGMRADPRGGQAVHPRAVRTGPRADRRGLLQRQRRAGLQAGPTRTRPAAGARLRPDRLRRHPGSRADHPGADHARGRTARARAPGRAAAAGARRRPRRARAAGDRAGAAGGARKQRRAAGLTRPDPFPRIREVAPSMPISLPDPAAARAATEAPAVNTRVALAVVATVFFMWGFLTCLNDILIPHLKAVFELNYARAMLVQFTFFGAYFLMSLPAGRLVARLGYKKGIVAGLVIAGIGALGFWPAAHLRIYEAFLAALFVLATGITVLQVAANPYVALLGPEATSSSRLTLAQALNSLGTAIAPIFGGLLILGGTVKGAEELAALPAAQQLAYRAQEAQAV